MTNPISREKAPGSAFQVPRKADNKAGKTKKTVATVAIKKLSTLVAGAKLEAERVRVQSLCLFCKALYKKNGEYLKKRYPDFYEKLEAIVLSKKSNEKKDSLYENLLATHSDVSKIESLSFANSRLCSLPEDIGHFTGLKVISLRNTNISSVKQLEELQHIFTINLYGCQDTSFSEDQAPHVIRDSRL